MNIKKYCRPHIDDAALFSRTWPEHHDNTEQISQCPSDAKLLIWKKKCNFGKNEVKFLDHVVKFWSHIKQTFSRYIEAIRKISKPTKNLRRLLCLDSYYRDYITNFYHRCYCWQILGEKNVANLISQNSNSEFENVEKFKYF